VTRVRVKRDKSAQAAVPGGEGAALSVVDTR
jgi:hypothetical protein